MVYPLGYYSSILFKWCTLLGRYYSSSNFSSIFAIKNLSYLFHSSRVFREDEWELNIDTNITFKTPKSMKTTVGLNVNPELVQFCHLKTSKLWCVVTTSNKMWLETREKRNMLISRANGTFLLEEKSLWTHVHNTRFDSSHISKK